MANENVFLLYALLMGIFITFLYDILRIFRRVVPHGNFMVSLEDIGFWIYCAAEVFLLMYHESDGILRWFAVLGALMGMMLYRKTVSPFLVKYVTLVLRKLLSVLGKIGRILFRPMKIVLGKMKCAVDAAAVKAAHRKRRRQNRPQGRFLKKKLTHLLKMLKMMV